MKLLTSAFAALLLGAAALAPAAVSAAPSAGEAEPRKAKTTIPGSGTYRVGIDFRPGTYVSRSTGSLGGYWERLSCATGDFDCILANDNITGQAFVTILPSDKFFSTSLSLIHI